MTLKEFLSLYGYALPEIMVKEVIAGSATPKLIEQVKTMMRDLSSALEQEAIRLS